MAQFSPIFTVQTVIVTASYKYILLRYSQLMHSSQLSAVITLSDCLLLSLQNHRRQH